VSTEQFDLGVYKFNGAQEDRGSGPPNLIERRISDRQACRQNGQRIPRFSARLRPLPHFALDAGVGCHEGNSLSLTLASSNSLYLFNSLDL
jgi:hypothetical protein